MAEFTTERIGHLVREYIRQTLEDDEKCRTLSVHTISDLNVTGGSNMGQKEAESLNVSVMRWLQNEDHSFLHPVANNLLNKHGYDIDQESAAYKAFTRQLMIAFQSILKVRTKRSQGDYSVPDEELIPALKEEQASPKVATPIVQAKETVTLKFSEVVEKYVIEAEKGENWTEKTKDDYLGGYAMFVRAMGDLPVDQIDRAVVSEFKSILMRLPANLNKYPAYRDLSVQEILALKPKEKKPSVNTLNKRLVLLSSLFTFAVRNGYMAMNPAEGMRIKQPKRADQEREGYTEKDLKALFGSNEYGGQHNKSYTFWAPLIGLYSGCRLNEICQLHLEDIRQEDDVWVFDINAKEEKTLKRNASVRLVPVHPQLIELGLIDHARYLKERGEHRLFPELRQRRDGYGEEVSKWYQRFKVRFGFKNSLTFHSFRHTFITNLKHKQVDPFMIHELAGHSINSETMGRYGKRFPPELLLKEAIEKIDYGIDLSGLKWTP